MDNRPTGKEETKRFRAGPGAAQRDTKTNVEQRSGRRLSRMQHGRSVRVVKATLRW